MAIKTFTDYELRSIESDIAALENVGRDRFFPDNITNYYTPDLLRKWLIGMGMVERKVIAATNTVLANAYRVGEKYIDKVNNDDSDRRFGAVPKRGRDNSVSVDLDQDLTLLDALGTGDNFGTKPIKDPNYDRALQTPALEIATASNLSAESIARAAEAVINPRLDAAIKSLTSQLAGAIKLASEEESKNLRSDIANSISTIFAAKENDLAAELRLALLDTTERVAADTARSIARSAAEEIVLDRLIATAPKQGASDSDSIPEINATSQACYVPLVDPNYYFDPQALKVIRKALAMRENLYAYGDTGCGKTTHLEQVCGVMGRGLIRINPHDGATREMFLGGMKLINGETLFVEGALPRAMRLGLVLLVDEYSFLPPNLAAVLNPVLGSHGKLYIPETGEWIAPAPGFCVFATDNTGGKGDRSGQYTGTEVQNTATLDRFSFCLRMDYLPEGEEIAMLEKRFSEATFTNQIVQMVGLAREIRLAFSRGELAITLSTRKLIKFFEQRANGFSLREALDNTLLSWLDEDDKQLITTMLDRLDIHPDHIESNYQPTPSVDSESKKQEFLAAIAVGRKIEAIKILKNTFNLSLLEAKTLTENYIGHNGGWHVDSLFAQAALLAKGPTP